MSHATMAEALEDLQVGLTERDLVQALYEGVRQGWVNRLGHEPSAVLPEDQREFLDQFGGIGPRDASGPEQQFARVLVELSAEMASALTTKEVAQRLGLDPTRVRHRVRDRALYALPMRVNRSRVFPDWQFTEHGVVPHLGEVLRAMPEDLHPLEVSGFFHTPQDILEVGDVVLTPKDWLTRGGDPLPVVALAASFDASF